jgi:hypothetical protein
LDRCYFTNICRVLLTKGVDIVFSAIQRSPLDAGLVEQACAVLWCLADTEENRRRIATREGVNMLVDVLRNHTQLNSPEVIEHCCATLALLLEDSVPNQSAFVVGDGLELLVKGELVFIILQVR